MSALRDTIRDADDISEEIVDVPEWGCKLLIKDCSLDERAEILAASQDSQPDADGKLSAKAFKAMHASVIIATAHDPDTGERVFRDTDDDRALLRAKSGLVVERVAKVCMRAAGLSQEDAEEGKDGSGSADPTETQSTGSDSS